jgi:hypothetical protein
MKDFFVQTWTAYGNGETIENNGQIKTYLELRKEAYKAILDEVAFIARATEGAMSPEWVMSLPIPIRKQYVEDLEKEIKEREAKLNKNKQTK